MAQLVKAIEAEDTFANAPAVNAAISERNKLMDGLLSKINEVIGEYKQQETSLPKPTSNKINSHSRHSQQQRSHRRQWRYHCPSWER
jgi:hypothetical protein